MSTFIWKEPEGEQSAYASDGPTLAVLGTGVTLPGMKGRACNQSGEAMGIYLDVSQEGKQGHPQA